MKSIKKKWIFICSILLIILISGYYVLDKSANYIIHSFLIPKNTSTQQSLKKETSKAKELTPTEASSESQSQESPTTILKTNKDVEAQTPAADVSPNSSPKQEPGTLSTSNPAAKPPEQPKLKYEAEISPEKAQSAENSVSAKDKAKIMSILLSKLSVEEIKLFTQLAAGGLSVEDKRQAKKVFLVKLSEKEYNDLIAIASKLGLSEGKSYQDSLKENLK